MDGQNCFPFESKHNNFVNLIRIQFIVLIILNISVLNAFRQAMSTTKLLHILYMPRDYCYISMLLVHFPLQKHSVKMMIGSRIRLLNHYVLILMLRLKALTLHQGLRLKKWHVFYNFNTFLLTNQNMCSVGYVLKTEVVQ